MSYAALIQKYPFIWAWHQLTGSREYYITALIERAIRENAPKDAMYRCVDDGKWRTLRDLSEGNEMRERMDALLKRTGVARADS